MPRIELQPNEDFDDAMNRFNRKVRAAYQRRHYKRRYGYYEKPSLLRYKRHRMQRNIRRSEKYYSRIICAIDLDRQFRRTGRNAIGE